MLSRLVLRQGALRFVLQPEAHCRSAIILTSRKESSVAKNKESTISHLNDTVEPQVLLANWKKAYNLYNSPDRDYKNFPHPKQPDDCPPVRLGFIPESWFNIFYEKTGVTGPYLFGTAFVTTMLSKEIWVVNHVFTEVVTYILVVSLLVRGLGPTISKFVKLGQTNIHDDYYYNQLKATEEACQSIISVADKSIWMEEGQKHLFQAKRDNVDLTLEAEYRQRLSQVYKEVKRKLDYQVDMQNAKRQFEQSHMVNWIVENVIKGITPQQEKESISKCIQALKGMTPSMA